MDRSASILAELQPDDSLPATRRDSSARLTAAVSTIRERLAAEGLSTSSWSNGPGDRYAAHEHSYDKVLVVERGSITFGLPGTGGAHDLAQGDRLDLPAGIAHDAVVGPNGVTCLEAHLPAGSLAQVRRQAAGEW